MSVPKRHATLALLFFVSACGGGGGTDTTQPVVTVASITITASATAALVSIGETRTLNATAKDASGANVSSPTITWTTSNASVATVSGSNGSATVTATGNGPATITARSGSVQSTIDVTVAQVFATVTVGIASPAIAIGASTAATAVARDARNGAISGVTGATYTTSDRKVALVEASGAVTAIAPGTSTITASLTRDGITATGTATVTVSSPPASVGSASVNATASNTFTPSTVTIGTGGIVNFAFAKDHNVIFQGAGSPADVPVTTSGVVARTFLTAGSFAYVCTLHAGMSGSVIVTPPTVFAQMNGANERPTATNSQGNGAAVFTRTGATVAYTVTYQNVASTPTGLHIHAPGNANQTTGVLVDLLQSPLTSNSGVLTGTFTAANIRSIAGAPAISLDSLFVLMNGGNAYVNVHSSAFPAGEIRGQTGQP